MVKIGPRDWEFEHRLVMARKLGRILRPDEHVHHKDENGLNNDPDNLELMLKGQHMALHRRMEVNA